MTTRLNHALHSDVIYQELEEPSQDSGASFDTLIPTVVRPRALPPAQTPAPGLEGGINGAESSIQLEYRQVIQGLCLQFGFYLQLLHTRVLTFNPCSDYILAHKPLSFHPRVSLKCQHA